MYDGSMMATGRERCSLSALSHEETSAKWAEGRSIIHQDGVVV